MDAKEQEKTEKKERLPDNSEEVAAPTKISKDKGLRKPNMDKMFRGALMK